VKKHNISQNGPLLSSSIRGPLNRPKDEREETDQIKENKEKAVDSQQAST